ncbi:Crp/Fnr family transcriptional regulator [Pyxidicoccus fallax]|uniref:Crp/Fnr family transcriptional regulator n=1 Tax=Pyxidicoccus fallax TaxID=394095 RepID=A0A848L9R7_9BACT|nr:Crp/Fnr family transcriptional regulator [Pyxidicoccus fallax]NMO15599.1 Crp/Fnr family transcriptional regulator [Pyxidicoccus fallax]NPC82148.1 Crp/Fnr family transcriptional regulator [Pyxidicoccus fallax]
MAETGPEREELLSLRRGLEGLAPLPDAAWRDFAKVLKRRRLKASETWVRHGDTPDQVAVLSSGLMRLYYLREDGRELIKGFIRPGGWVAILDALLLKQPSRVTAEALAPSTLWTLPYRELERLCEAHAFWGLATRRLLERLYVRKVQREAAFLLDSPADRYLEFLREFADVQALIPDYHVASYLGVTPVALSRIRGRLGLVKRPARSAR